MQYHIIPQTDLRVSTICLGTAQFGSALQLDESFALLDAFVEQGGNFIDTARVYAAWIPGGLGISEETIGAWLRAKGLSQSIVVATKGGHPELSAMHASRLDKAEVGQDCEDSLRALGVDAIGLYWLHRDDERRSVADILETMEGLVAAGKIRAYGFSNWKVSRMREAVQTAAALCCTGFVANQPMWSLADVNPESILDPTLVWMDQAMKDFHRSVELAVVPYTSQARGFFAKSAVVGIDNLVPALKRAYDNPVNRDRLQRLIHWANETGWSVSSIALAYLTSQRDFVTIPVIGASNLQQLQESLQTADIDLTAEIIHDLEHSAH